MNGKRSLLYSRLIVSAAVVLFGCAAANAQADATAPAAAPGSPPAAAQAQPQAATPSTPAAVPSVPAAAPAGDAAQPAAGQPPAGIALPGQQAQSEQLPNACFAYPAKLKDSEVDEFLAKPELIFAQYSSGGVALSNRVRSLAGSDRRTLDPLLRLAAAAKPDEKAMIGAGLGRAAFACSRTAPAYAALIQSMIAGINSPELLTAFLSATNDIQTAAIGAGAAAGGNGGGLSGNGFAGPFSAGLGGDEVVPTTAQTYSNSARSIVLIDDNDDDDNDSVSPANID